jgi:hypothetical protein
MANENIKRLAIFEAWGGKCQWCKKPITYRDMEIDHILPAAAESDTLDRLLEMHGLPEGYDLQATYNLICSCRTCNRYKSDRTPPDAPIIRTVLGDAIKRAPIVEKHIIDFGKRNKLEKLLASLDAYAEEGKLDGDASRRLHDITNRIALNIALVTGATPAPAALHRQIDPHDWQPPRVKEKKLRKHKVGKTRMLIMIEEWARNHPDADDVVVAAFDSDEGDLESMHPTDVTRVGYAAEVGEYLVRVNFDVSYIFSDGGPADTDFTVDLWVKLNDERAEIESASEDLWTSFG